MHLLLLCGEVDHGGHGCHCNILLTLRVNHEEGKLPDLRNDIPSLLGRDQGNKTRWDYLEYRVQFPVQSNNNTVMPRLIYNMTFPEIRLSQNNITKFKGSNITQYLIFEWLDDV
jgi:hypothetical protein